MTSDLFAEWVEATSKAWATGPGPTELVCTNGPGDDPCRCFPCRARRAGCLWAAEWWWFFTRPERQTLFVHVLTVTSKTTVRFRYIVDVGPTYSRRWMAKARAWNQGPFCDRLFESLVFPMVESVSSALKSLASKLKITYGWGIRDTVRQCLARDAAGRTGVTRFTKKEVPLRYPVRIIFERDAARKDAVEQTPAAAYRWDNMGDQEAGEEEPPKLRQCHWRSTVFELLHEYTDDGPEIRRWASKWCVSLGNDTRYTRKGLHEALGEALRGVRLGSSLEKTWLEERLHEDMPVLEVLECDTLLLEWEGVRDGIEYPEGWNVKRQVWGVAPELRDSADPALVTERCANELLTTLRGSDALQGVDATQGITIALTIPNVEEVEEEEATKLAGMLNKAIFTTVKDMVTVEEAQAWGVSASGQLTGSVRWVWYARGCNATKTKWEAARPQGMSHGEERYTRTFRSQVFSKSVGEAAQTEVNEKEGAIDVFDLDPVRLATLVGQVGGDPGDLEAEREEDPECRVKDWTSSQEIGQAYRARRVGGVVVGQPFEFQQEGERCHSCPSKQVKGEITECTACLGRFCSWCVKTGVVSTSASGATTCELCQRQLRPAHPWTAAAGWESFVHAQSLHPLGNTKPLQVKTHNLLHSSQTGGETYEKTVRSERVTVSWGHRSTVVSHAWLTLEGKKGYARLTAKAEDTWYVLVDFEDDVDADKHPRVQWVPMCSLRVYRMGGAAAGVAKGKCAWVWWGEHEGLEGEVAEADENSCVVRESRSGASVGAPAGACVLASERSLLPCPSSRGCRSGSDSLQCGVCLFQPLRWADVSNLRALECNHFVHASCLTGGALAVGCRKCPRQATYPKWRLGDDPERRGCLNSSEDLSLALTSVGCKFCRRPWECFKVFPTEECAGPPRYCKCTQPCCSTCLVPGKGGGSEPRTPGIPLFRIEGLHVLPILAHWVFGWEYGVGYPRFD